MQLTVIGLGVKSGDISVDAFAAIKRAEVVLLRTGKTDSARFLNEQGISFDTLDNVYEKSRNFETLNKNLVAAVKERLKTSDVCYLVDGAVSEDRCAKQLISAVKNVIVYEGVSKAGDALVKCGIKDDCYTAISAYALGDFMRFTFPLVIYDLDSNILASEWKLKLFTIVGEETKVRLYIDKQPKTLALYEIDREKNFDYSTVLIVEEEPLSAKQRFDFYDLMTILRILRSPNGCPWDKAQTMYTIRKNLVEEAYELIDAIDKNDDDKMCEETGDMLLQVAFHILFAEEREAYTAEDVISAVCRKLVFRHTHIFAGEKATDAESALGIWNKNKQKEKGFTSVSEYVDDVPMNLPALLRTEKVVKRASASNFDVFDDDAVVKEITDMLSDKAALDVNCGRLLFDLVYLIKKNGGSPEEKLADETKAFIAKLRAVEDKLNNSGLDIKTADRQLLVKLYNET